MYNVVKWPNILLKPCGVHTATFLKYVWPFYNIMHERVKDLQIILLDSEALSCKTLAFQIFWKNLQTLKQTVISAVSTSSYWGKFYLLRVLTYMFSIDVYAENNLIIYYGTLQRAISILN